MEYILSHFPYAEISILGDFNVHDQFLLSSSTLTEHLMNKLSNLHDLNQLV